MSTQAIPLTTDALKAWSNNPDAVRNNLRTVFAGLKADESTMEWATEALENCGAPLESDLDFLGQATQECESDVDYWACKLIGRLGDKANALQNALTSVVSSASKSLTSRQQAALALASIGTLTPSSRESLQNATRSDDARLARISTQALGSGS